MTPDDESRAAEYVLGVMSAEERATFSRDVSRDPALATAVREWEVRLAPLARDVADVAPPPGLFRRIEDAIAPSSMLQAARARAQRWRVAALGFAAISIGLALYSF